MCRTADETDKQSAQRFLNRSSSRSVCREREAPQASASGESRSDSSRLRNEPHRNRFAPVHRHNTQRRTVIRSNRSRLSARGNRTIHSRSLSADQPATKPPPAQRASPWGDRTLVGLDVPWQDYGRLVPGEVFVLFDSWSMGKVAPTVATLAATTSCMPTCDLEPGRLNWRAVALTYLRIPGACSS